MKSIVRFIEEKLGLIVVKLTILTNVGYIYSIMELYLISFIFPSVEMRYYY